MSSKTKEAEEAIQEAEKHLKTSFTKWRPDYDSAAHAYQKAATAYKAAKNIPECLKCHLKAADTFSKNRQHFSAAKSYEQAALICGKELSDWDNAIAYIEKASSLFRENGVADTAALCLDRGAKMIENARPEKAAELYALASEVSMLESKAHQAAEFCSKSARLYLKLKKFEEAIDLINRQFNYLRETENERSCGRIVVCQILVHLTREDFVAAQKAFNDGKCYLEDDEMYSMTQLLNGFDQMDSQAIVQAVQHPFIKSLDNEFSKLARSLQQKHQAMISSSPEHQSGASAQADDAESALLL